MKYRDEFKDQVFLEIAARLAELGTCDRRHVGALIVRDGRCVSWGYNGAPPGMTHCAENNHGWAGTDRWQEHLQGTGVESDDFFLHRVGCANATHAEMNTVAFAARQGISTANGTLYVTLSPCDVCARTLVAAGIDRVVYGEQYRDTRGLDILREAGVVVG